MSVSWLFHDEAGSRAGARISMRAAAASLLAAAVIAGVAPAGASGPGPATATVFAGGVGGPGPALQIALSGPCGMTSTAGHVFFTEQVNLSRTGNLIRDLNERTGWLSTAAGIGLPGTTGVGGPAVQARIGDPCALTVDHYGNLVMLTTFNVNATQSIGIVAATSGTFYGQRMQKGHFYQIAGQFAFGNGIAVDYAGNLVLTVPGYVDTEGITEWNAFVEVLAVKSGTFYGQRMTAGQFYSVNTLGGTDIGGVTVDPAGNPVADVGGTANPGPMMVIAARSGTFDGRRMQAGHSYPLNITSTAAVDHYGNFVFVAGNPLRLAVLAERSGAFYGRRMRAGHVYTIAEGSRFGASSLTVDSAGNVVLAVDFTRVRVFAVRSGRFYGQAMRAMHTYLVAGTASRLSDSGDGGDPARAELGFVAGSSGIFSGVSADPGSDVYLSDAPDYRVQMVPGRSGVFFGQKMRAGDIYTIAGNEKDGNAANGVLATSAELGYNLEGVTTDRAGNVLIADYQYGKIRVVAAKTGTFYGIAMKAARLYTIAGGGTQKPADGVLATAARFNPAGLQVDGHGNVLLTDSASSGVFAVAASTGTFYGHQMTAGHLYLLAGGGSTGGVVNGGPAVGSQLVDPMGLALDHAGNILIADNLAKLVLVVPTTSGTFYGQKMTAADIYTIAGGGTAQGSGHPATQSAIGDPDGLAIDRSGNVLVSTSVTNNLLQVIAARSGTFYGQPMSAGNLYTIAGGGYGLIPGNRPATKIALLNPAAIAVEPSGDVLLSELPAARLLLIHP